MTILCQLSILLIPSFQIEAVVLLSGILSISAYDFTQFYIVQNMYLAGESPKGSACELIVPIPSNTFPMRRPTA